MTLPPLPEPAHEQVEDYSGIAVNKVVVTPLFTAGQMRAYAEQAVAAERERWQAAANRNGHLAVAMAEIVRLRQQHAQAMADMDAEIQKLRDELIGGR